MLNTVYRLVAPRRFEVEFSDIDVDKGVIVRPTHLSICHADQRYFQGNRAPEVLEQKLPMALIHEGIGKVVYDPLGEFASGQRVVMIPNTPVESDEIIAENYLRTSKFRGSGYDGFMQENVQMERDRIICLPDGIDDCVAAFMELVSVSRHAISRFLEFSHARREHIAIWGDGNLGFITAVLVKYCIPEAKMTVLGLDMDKLSSFSFADQVYSVRDIPEDFTFDHAFECVGGSGSQPAISQIIDYIKPEGTISFLGVSENPPAINTRMILEKGLRVFGTSRSGREDFKQTIELYQKHPEVVEYFKNLIGATIEVRSVADMSRAFEMDVQKAYGKTIMIWS